MNKYLKAVLIILFYFIYSIVIYVPFVALNINLSSIPNILLNIYYINAEAILIISLIFIYLKDFKKYFKDFKENGKSYFKIGFNYWVIGVSVMIISNILISTLSPLSIPENEQAVREALKMSPFLILISSVISAPLIEEILFRKVPFNLFKNKYIYVAVSGLLFGAFHIIGIGTSIYSWLYIIPYSALGIVFAYAYVKTNNLLTPICLHAFHNLITVIQVLLLL